MAHGTIKTEYARAPRRLRVWQRLFLALGFGFVLMLLGTAVVDFDRQPADTAAAGAAASKARANMANRIIETFPVWRRLPALSTACCASIIIRTSRRRPELLSGTTER